MKLWQTDSNHHSNLTQLIEDFTVGNDYILDSELIPYDIQASIAHAEGLQKIGILNPNELKKIKTVLLEILELHQNQKFEIQKSQEDGHTAIEEYLVKELGEIGKKIHTGRSRNDQVLVSTRLWQRENIDQIIYSTKNLAQLFLNFSNKYEFMPMPGFTHTQVAMPSSAGMWAGSFAEMSILNLQELINFRNNFNLCPLGSAAGFGVDFDLPREETARKLGFDDCLTISLTSQNTRGKIEADLVSHLSNLSSTLALFANDLVLYTSSQFQFFTVKDELTTGSSIMPQKKNLDPAELLRASHAKILGYESTLKHLTTNLISGYHRDLQLSKEPTMESIKTVQNMLQISQALIDNITPNESRLIEAFDPTIFAADKANNLVAQGMPFREAYLKVKEELEELKTEPVTKEEIFKNLKSKTHLGATGNLGLEKLRNKLNQL